MLWIVIGVVVLLLAALVYLYNRLVSLRNRVENAWAQVDVQLKRRYDLIPNLVETVKGYAAHERETFEAVTPARSRAQAAQGPAQQSAAEGILGPALGPLLAALALAGDAAAKSFTLPAADVTVQLQEDGSVIVDEVIAFEFAGDFSGAFREIPLREG